MADVARQHLGRRRAFAQIMRQAGQAHREWRLQAGGHVQHHHQVDASVNFGVIFGALRHAPEGIHFGQHHAQSAALAQHVKHPRRLLLHQPACQLLPHALGHQVIGLAVLDHFAH